MFLFNNIVSNDYCSKHIFLSVIALLVIILGVKSDINAQGFYAQEWIRTASVHDNAAFRTPYFSNQELGFTSLPVEYGLFLNTDRTWSPNSGNSWQGKGVSNSASLGFRYRSRFLDVQLQPQFVYARNLTFPSDDRFVEHEGYQFFQYYHDRINYQDRIAPGTFNTLYPGNSWLRLVLGPISAGISSENIHWGPGRRNPLLLNSDAPGFEHFTLHSNRPLNLYFGKLQSHIVIGRLNSSYNENDHLPSGRVHFSGINIAVSPWFSDNLHVGLIRTFIVNERDLNDFDDYVPFFQSFLKFRFQTESNTRGNDRHDQRASAYFNWHFPNSRFSIYGEFASDDHRADLRDLFLEPNHTRAYLLGFEKSFFGVMTNRLWTLNSEIVQTEYTSTMYVRNAGLLSFYTHGTVRQGYTHYGQMIGSSYGAGSNGFYISALNETSWGSLGFIIERVAKNKDLFQRLYTVDLDARPELEMVFGIFGEYHLSLKEYGQIRFKSAIHAVQAKNRFYLPTSYSEDEMKPLYYNPLNLNFQFIILYDLPRIQILNQNR